jgi:hypothetical protein
LAENGTSTLADPSGLEAAQELLGALLVSRELITPAQLEEALEEQETSGLQLGQIIVARGFASAATVAQALATQHGGLMKSEYGFATGFGTGASVPGTVDAPPVSPVSARREAAEAARRDPEVSAAPAEGPREAVSPEREDVPTARVADLEAQIAELTAGAFAWERTYGALKQELEQLRASFAAGETERAELEQKLTTEIGRNAALRVKAVAEQSVSADAATAARVQLESRLAQATAQLEQQKAIAAKLEQRVAALETELEQRQAEPTASAETDPWAGAKAHLLFFQGSKGYELVEKPGPPPAPGTYVDDQLVARVALGAVPAALPCAYLVA